MSAPPVLSARAIGKRFGGTVALADVDLDLEPGTLHALVGENGAGKSTLGKILGGVQRPDRGELRVGGRPVVFRAPVDALAQGIALITQELSLVPARTAIENVFLGVESSRFGVVRRDELRSRFAALVEATGLEVPGDVPVQMLRPPDRLKTEVLRALARDARVIVLDEPTAYLMREDAAHLADAIRSLRAAGTAFVYISHFLDEVLGLADTVTVLRDGRTVACAPARSYSASSLVTAMSGREIDVAFPKKAPPPADASVVLSVEGLRSLPVVQDFSMTVRAGEIVGLAGLVGSGRTEVARALFGAGPISSGHVTIDGRRVDAAHPAAAIRHGVAMIPESRKEALWLSATIRENASLASLPEFTTWGFVSQKRETAALQPALDRLRVKCDGIESPVGHLSGGNQQKVVFAKWLRKNPRVLIADEPTRGIDVATKVEIYELLVRLAAEGLAIVLISSEVEELIGLAHRIVVMRAGKVVVELDGDTTPETLLEAAFTDTRAFAPGKAA